MHERHEADDRGHDEEGAEPDDERERARSRRDPGPEPDGPRAGRALGSERFRAGLPSEKESSITAGIGPAPEFLNPGTIGLRERDRGRPGGDRVPLREGRAHGARDDRRGPRLDVPPSRRPAAGARGGRADRQHQRRLPRGRRRRHGADRDGRGQGPAGRLGPHGRRRRRLGPRPGLQRRDRGVHRTRRSCGGGRERAPHRARGRTPDLRGRRRWSPTCRTWHRARAWWCATTARSRGRSARRPSTPRRSPRRGSCSPPIAPRSGSFTGGVQGVRRGAGAAAAAPDLRRRARRDPARADRGRARLERDRRRRPPRLPDAGAVPRRARVRRRSRNRRRWRRSHRSTSGRSSS